MNHSYVTVTDQFCGAGGSSLGAVAGGAEVVLGMNHWKLAIETHSSNFPKTDHVCTDISAADPRRFPRTDILITSPECTNHTIAKGRARVRYEHDLFGKTIADPAEERSRATMWDVVRFSEQHQYEIVIVENVIDVRAWVLWDAWLAAMRALGYAWRLVSFNSMFAPPTPQSRDRLYVVFWRSGNRAPHLDVRPSAWCERCGRDVEAAQTWKRTERAWGRYGPRGQYVYTCPECRQTVSPYYAPALTAIDWSLPVERIGDRGRPLQEATLQRIRIGLERFKDRYLMLDVGRGADGRHVYPATAAAPTQTGQQTLGLVRVPFLTSYYGAGTVLRETCKAMATLTGNDRHGLVQMPFTVSQYNGPFRNPVHAVSEPLMTVPSMAVHSLAQPSETPRVEDCGFRMLQPHEIQAAMAFPRDYTVLGTKRERVRQLGNAVTPPVMSLLIERCLATLAG